MSRWCHSLAHLWIAIAAALCLGSARAEVLSIGGTGGPLATLRLLGQATSERDPGLHVEIVFSLGTEGSLRALADGALDIAVMARALKAEDRALGLDQIELGRTAVVFITSHRTIRSIQTSDIERIFAGTTTHWADGTPVRLILRRGSESDLQVLRRRTPSIAPLLDDLHRRREIPIAATAQENFDLAETTPGSLAIGTLAQLITERRGIHVLSVDGSAPSLDSLRTGTYPYTKPIHLAFRRPPSARVKAFLGLVASERGRAILMAAGWLSSSQPDRH